LQAETAIVPWPGPMMRVAAVLPGSAANLLMPLIKVQIVGLAFVFNVALTIEKREEMPDR